MSRRLAFRCYIIVARGDLCCYIISTQIAFDPAKREWTLRERGLDMADAAAIFAGPVLMLKDERENYGEDRFIAFGLLSERLVLCVYTDRGDVRRIISLRKANEREQARFLDRLV